MSKRDYMLPWTQCIGSNSTKIRNSGGWLVCQTETPADSQFIVESVNKAATKNIKRGLMENEKWKRRAFYLAKWVAKATKESMGNIMEATNDYVDALLTGEQSAVKDNIKPEKLRDYKKAYYAVSKRLQIARKALTVLAEYQDSLVAKTALDEMSKDALLKATKEIDDATTK